MTEEGVWAPGVCAEEAAKHARAQRRFYNLGSVACAAALSGVAVFLLQILAIPVGIVLWTGVFIFILRTPVDFLERHGVKRGLGTAIAYVALFVAVGLVSFLVFSPQFGISAQINGLIQKMPEYLSSASAWLTDMYARYSSILESDDVQQMAAGIMDSVIDWSKGVASQSASGVVAAGSVLVNICVTVGFAVVISFGVIAELPQITREFGRMVSPKRQEDYYMLRATLTRVMGGYLKGTLVQCVVIGVGCAILYTVLGVPAPAALAIIAGVLNIIPIVGPWIAGCLALVITVFSSPLTALIAFLGTIAVQQVVYTFVSPRVMGKSVDIHPAFTFIALMSGSALGGAMGGLLGALVGALLSIPAVAFAKSVFVYYFEKRTGRRIVASDGVFFKGDAAPSAPADPLRDAVCPSADDEGSERANE